MQGRNGSPNGGTKRSKKRRMEHRFRYVRECIFTEGFLDSMYMENRRCGQEITAKSRVWGEKDEESCKKARRQVLEMIRMYCVIGKKKKQPLKNKEV